jgi:hypothetical protein
MDYFGGRNVSGIIGILCASVAFGTLVGPSDAGFAFDLSHGYTVPILASAAANFVAAVIVAATKAGAGNRAIGQTVFPAEPAGTLSGAETAAVE